MVKTIWRCDDGRKSPLRIRGEAILEPFGWQVTNVRTGRQRLITVPKSQPVLSVRASKVLTQSPTRWKRMKIRRWNLSSRCSPAAACKHKKNELRDDATVLSKVDGKTVGNYATAGRKRILISTQTTILSIFHTNADRSTNIWCIANLTVKREAFK